MNYESDPNPQLEALELVTGLSSVISDCDHYVIVQ